MPRGSKPGEHRGGRKKGVPNRKTAALQQVVAATGLMPLEYMIQVLQDEKSSVDARRWAATTAAPYLHPRFGPKEPPRAATETGGASTISDRDLARRIAYVLMRASDSPEE